MESKTKTILDKERIAAVFERADMSAVKRVEPINSGEYNSIYSVATEYGEYILKIAPSPDTEVMTYERDLMRSEVYWYDQMRSNTNVRTPAVLYVDYSHELLPNDYFIMEKLSGFGLNSKQLNKEEKAQSAEIIANILADIHSVSNDKFGYIQNMLYDNWYKALRSFVADALDDCKRKNRVSRMGQKLLKYVEQFSSILEDVECCMVNFDMWSGNLICQRKNGGLECACIDPERSFWGDRMMDMVYLEPLKMQLKGKAKAVEIYNKTAKNPVKGTAEEKIRLALAEGYLGLIVETEKYYRYSPLNFGWWRNVLLSKLYYHNSFKALRNAQREG